MVQPEHGQAAQGPAVGDLTGTTVGRFAVCARLGAGGMGEVYRAEDTKLKRSVALKRLAPSLQADEQYRQRFWKEAERASCLNDPHIAAIYDIFEARGESFLVMEYVEGVTLRRRLQEPVSLEQFFPLAVECAEALAAAHEKGIIHRDIKPENIMLTPAGQVKVLDFGVAKRLAASEQDSSTASLQTASGTISGTAGYMAPEVLLDKEPDGRADIFSLGIVFYEALSGRHPFLGANFVATSDRILHDVPPPVSQTNPRVPQALDSIVARMLAKDPAGRYATARALADDLRALTISGRLSLSRRRRPGWRTTLGIATLVIAFLLFLALPPVQQRIRNWLTRSEIPQEKNLAVLPFVAVGGDPKATAFGDGLTETLTAKLTQLTEQRPLQVVPSSDVRARHISSAEQARDGFGVNLVFEGSLHRAGDLVRVNITLVNATTGRTIRAETITASTSDLFALEDQAVNGAVQMLGLEVKPQERPALAVHGTRVAGAFDLYLQGRGYLQNYQKTENIENAISVFQQALQLDPNFALASASLGEAYWKKYEAGKDSSLVPMTRLACDRAVELDTGLAEAHMCLGTLYSGTGQYERSVEEYQRALDREATRDDAYRGLAAAYQRLGKLEEAERTFQRAISLRPQYWASYSWLGIFYAGIGKYEKAAEMFTKVTELAPDNHRGYYNLGVVDYLLGRWPEAEQMYKKSIGLHESATAYSNLGTLYFYQGRYSDAARAFEAAVRLSPQDSLVRGNLADVYRWTPGQGEKAERTYREAVALAAEQLRVNPREAETLANLALWRAKLGLKGEAAQAIERALALAPTDPRFMYSASVVYHLAGDRQRSGDWLKKALEHGYPAREVRADPELRDLHDDPAFRKLVEGR